MNTKTLLKKTFVLKPMKVNFDNHEQLADCPKCSKTTESFNEGYNCYTCDILFNVCKKCNNGNLCNLKAWGLIHIPTDDTSEESNFDEEDEYYKFTNLYNDGLNLKMYATRNDNDALTDISKYRWSCSVCNYEEILQAD